MRIVRIEILQNQHFIIGDEYCVFLKQDDRTIAIAVAVKTNEYLTMCENLEGLKWRLEKLGNKVIVETKFVPDPNFKSEEEAAEYFENKDLYKN